MKANQIHNIEFICVPRFGGLVSDYSLTYALSLESKSVSLVDDIHDLVTENLTCGNKQHPAMSKT